MCHDIDFLYKSHEFLKKEAQYCSKGCAMIQMHKKQKQNEINHKDEKEKRRQERLAQQLRQNLKRRKEQSRERAKTEL